jgi:hypothetical protein
MLNVGYGLSKLTHLLSKQIVNYYSFLYFVYVDVRFVYI